MEKKRLVRAWEKEGVVQGKEKKIRPGFVNQWGEGPLRASWHFGIEKENHRNLDIQRALVSEGKKPK